ncbi:MAG: hypothetical protein K1060chlam5_00227 [Candidatus Anoxychlamydiales bacterium]|nr:hypothetical protein [Candidatus Anoxychlamydiales bacterium]
MGILIIANSSNVFKPINPKDEENDSYAQLDKILQVVKNLQTTHFKANIVLENLYLRVFPLKFSIGYSRDEKLTIDNVDIKFEHILFELYEFSKIESDA